MKLLNDSKIRKAYTCVLAIVLADVTINSLADYFDENFHFSTTVVRYVPMLLLFPLIWCMFRLLRRVEREYDIYRNVMDDLRKKEKNLERAQQMAQIGNWEWDLITGAFNMSKEMYRMHGIPEDMEPSPEWMKAVVYPDESEKLSNIVKQAIRSKSFSEYELKITRPDGEIRHLRTQAEFVTDEQGKYTHIFGVTQDITERKKSEQELNRTMLQLQRMFDHLNILYFSTDWRTKKVLYVNNAVEKVFGVCKERYMEDPKAMRKIIYPPDLKIFTNAILDIENIGGKTVEFRIVHPLTGEIRWIQSSFLTTLTENEEDVILSCLSIDITERKRQQEMIKAQHEVLSQLAKGIPLSEVLETIAEIANDELPERKTAILLLNEEQFIVGAAPYFPDTFSDMVSRIRMGSESPIGRAAYDKTSVLISDMASDPEWLQEHVERSTIPSGFRSCWIYPILSSSGRLLGVFSLYSGKTGLPKDYENEMIDALVQLTALALERMQSEKEIQMLAYYDPLTGLGNRRYLMNELDRQIELSKGTGRKFALFVIDLDQLKFVNDSLGHDAGDMIIVELANRLSHITGDRILARIGGDEFILILPHVASEKDMIRIAQRIIEICSEPITLSGHEYRTAPSIGISIYPDHGTTSSVLLRHADNAMYRAKEEGRNTYKLFDPLMKEKAYERFVLKSELEKALARQEFELHYQPRVELESEVVKGVEALLRWKHPEKGMIPPVDFIPLAEETGFIVTLGEWVLWEACRQNKDWQNKGLEPVRVAVNVTTQQFRQPGFVEMVRRTLEETALSPQWLEIEITESALMSDEEQMIRILSELSDLGVYISIDDFGTGYSSLSYLKRFKVNALKIDRSFIRDIPGDQEDVAITTTIIALARSLGLQVTAEGVEHKDQVDFLKLHGCDSIQGYYYGKPVPADEVVSVIKKVEESRRVSGIRSGRGSVMASSSLNIG